MSIVNSGTFHDEKRKQLESRLGKYLQRCTSLRERIAVLGSMVYRHTNQGYIESMASTLAAGVDDPQAQQWYEEHGELDPIDARKLRDIYIEEYTESVWGIGEEFISGGKFDKELFDELFGALYELNDLLGVNKLPPAIEKKVIWIASGMVEMCRREGQDEAEVKLLHYLNGMGADLTDKDTPEKFLRVYRQRKDDLSRKDGEFIGIAIHYFRKALKSAETREERLKYQEGLEELYEGQWTTSKGQAAGMYMEVMLELAEMYRPDNADRTVECCKRILETARRSPVPSERRDAAKFSRCKAEALRILAELSDSPEEKAKYYRREVRAREAVLEQKSDWDDKEALELARENSQKYPFTGR